MAASINQRIVLTGADEVRRHLDEIAAAGQRAGNTTRAALLAATSGATAFTAGTRAAAASSGQMRFALQNLSFQVNDVATSLASGGDAMRVFAQQGGQIFQAFQQGGGLGNVLRAAGSAIASFITPTTAAVAGFAALAGGFALLVERAASAQDAARKFDVILQGMRKNTGVTGKQLEQVAENLHDVGISASEARPLIDKFLQAGGDPRQAEKVLRTAADVQAVLGTSIEEFTVAAGKGGPALEEYAKRLGIVAGQSKEVQQQQDAAAESAKKFNDAITEANRERQKQLRDLTRAETRAENDRIRQKSQVTRGRTPEQQQEEDQAVEHARRIEDINRESAAQINAIISARNAESAKQLAAYNQTILAEAQTALDTGNGLLNQIAQAVSGANTRALSPFQQAIRDIATAWNELLDTMSNSTFITQIIVDITSMITSIKEAIQWIDKMVAAFKQTPALPTSLGGPGEPVAIQSNAAGGLIRGPGTGTSDSIISRLSDGEYVNTAASVRRFGVGFFESLNRMSMPAMPRFRMPRGFAMGGLVTAGAGGGGTPVHFHLDGRSFQLMGERGVVDALTRAARQAAITSAGPKPSWYGGGRG